MDLKAFYDEYVGRQLAVGVNERHHAILRWLRRFGLCRGDRVLEIGCGVGTLTGLIASAIGPEGFLLAVDLSPKSIEAASHLMMALPRSRGEMKAAMLGAKSTLLMEKRVLESMGYTAHLGFIHYQNFTISREYVARIMEAASEIPDEYVHRVMAIGEMGDVEEKIDSLAKAGAKQLAIADFLAPRTVRRTLESFAKVLGNYS